MTCEACIYFTECPDGKTRCEKHDEEAHRTDTSCPDWSDI